MKNIIVTGANRGIGKEIARQLVERGHKVIACVRSKEKGIAALDGICDPEDIWEVELSDSDSVRNLAEGISKNYSQIDVLINNAGVISKPTSIVNSTDEEEVFQSNFFGPWRMVKAFYPMLRKAGAARIINMSSGMGSHEDLKIGSYAAYRLSKAALNDFTIQLASELSADGIAVNAMCPGWVKTDMGGSAAPVPSSSAALRTKVRGLVSERCIGGACSRDMWRGVRCAARQRSQRCAASV